MIAKAGYSTPLLRVAEIEKSIAFYKLIGITTIDTDGCKPLGWARLHCEDGSAVMFWRTQPAVDSSAQAFMLYLYTPNLHALREHLLANDVKVSSIHYPGYMPSGEINLTDPDGFQLKIAHWGKAEQEAWVQHLSATAGDQP